MTAAATPFVVCRQIVTLLDGVADDDRSVPGEIVRLLTYLGRQEDPRRAVELAGSPELAGCTAGELRAAALDVLARGIAA